MTEFDPRQIEFIGGPFDGHVEHVSLAADALPEDWVWLVSANVFRLLEGRDVSRSSRITSVAIYERRQRGVVYRYQFVRAVSPRALSALYPHISFTSKS